jgi:hypothetical protein
MIKLNDLRMITSIFVLVVLTALLTMLVMSNLHIVSAQSQTSMIKSRLEN